MGEDREAKQSEDPGLEMVLDGTKADDAIEDDAPEPEKQPADVIRIGKTRAVTQEYVSILRNAFGEVLGVPPEKISERVIERHMNWGLVDFEVQVCLAVSHEDDHAVYSVSSPENLASRFREIALEHKKEIVVPPPEKSPEPEAAPGQDTGPAKPPLLVELVKERARELLAAPEHGPAVSWVLESYPEFYEGMEPDKAVNHAEEMLESAAAANVLPRIRKPERALSLDLKENKAAREALTAFIDKSYHPNGEKKPEPEEPAAIRLYDFLDKKRPGHFKGQGKWNKGQRKRNIATLLVDEGVMEGEEREGFSPSAWTIPADGLQKQEEILATIDKYYQRNGLRRKKEAEKPEPEPETPPKDPEKTLAKIVSDTIMKIEGLKKPPSRNRVKNTVQKVNDNEGLLDYLTPTGEKRITLVAVGHENIHEAEDVVAKLLVSPEPEPEEEPEPEPKPKPEIPSLAQIITYEAGKIEGLELSKCAIIGRAKKYRKAQKVRKNLKPTGKGTGRRYPIKSQEHIEPVREAVRELLMDSITGLTTTIDYIIEDFPGLFKECGSDEEIRIGAEEIENEIYANRILEEHEIAFKGTARYFNTNDKDKKDAVEGFLWEEYLQHLPPEEEKEPEPEQKPESAPQKPPLPAPEPEKTLAKIVSDTIMKIEGLKKPPSRNRVKNTVQKVNGNEELLDYLAPTGERRITLVAVGHENIHEAEDVVEKLLVSPEPEPEQPPDIMLDRDYVLQNHPDLFAHYGTEGSKKTMANKLVSEMIEAGEIEEQEVSYKGAIRWHYADDKQRQRAIDTYIRKHCQKPGRTRKTTSPAPPKEPEHSKGGGKIKSDIEWRIHTELVAGGHESFRKTEKTIITGYNIRKVGGNGTGDNPLVIFLSAKDCREMDADCIEEDFRVSLAEAGLITDLQPSVNISYKDKKVAMAPTDFEGIALLEIYRQHVIEPEIEKRKR